MPIGTLNEGPLHQALKAAYLDRYATSGRAASEVRVGAFVADVVGDDGVVYEIQTGEFGPIRRKLARLVEEHRVVLVCPIAARRTIVKLPESPDTDPIRRRSPKRGHPALVFERLVSIPTLLAHTNFELEVVMVEEEEVRRFDPRHVRRRGGWRVVERLLGSVIDRHRFRTHDDLFDLLDRPLPDEFTTADIAAALGQPRELAQQMAYVLREGGATVPSGKAGNVVVYRRSSRG